MTCSDGVNSCTPLLPLLAAAAAALLLATSLLLLVLLVLVVVLVVVVLPQATLICGTFCRTQRTPCSQQDCGQGGLLGHTATPLITPPSYIPPSLLFLPLISPPPSSLFPSPLPLQD